MCCNYVRVNVDYLNSFIKLYIIFFNKMRPCLQTIKEILVWKTCCEMINIIFISLQKI